MFSLLFLDLLDIKLYILNILNTNRFLTRYFIDQVLKKNNFGFMVIN